jgi:hypothetical protein
MDTDPQDILVLGDSHAVVFEHPLFGQCFPNVTLQPTIVYGATASGMENPNDSKTQAYPLFMRTLAENAAPKVIVTLGEVDTGFVIWHRAVKYQESIHAMMDRALRAYMKLLEEISATRDVLCLSTALPTIRDGTCWGEVANLRKEVTATQRERTALTLVFNHRIQAFCLRRRIDYLMLDPVSLGADGLVREELRNPNPGNHHYEAESYASLIIPRLAAFVARGALSSPTTAAPANAARFADLAKRDVA